MTKKIFKSSILASVIVLIIGMACVLGVLYRHFGGQIINELKKEAEYLSYGVELKGKDYLENVNEQDSRITYIDDAGNVLYDSMADEEAMENHKDREEFLEAEETGVGQAERISDTLSERTLYYAVRLSDNSVLRVSSTQDSVLALTVDTACPGDPGGTDHPGVFFCLPDRFPDRGTSEFSRSGTSGGKYGVRRGGSSSEQDP